MSYDGDDIRQAAALMRRRADAANTDETRRPYGDERIDPVPEDQWPILVSGYLGGDIGKHCAGWTPAAAHAVADLLDVLAAAVDEAAPVLPAAHVMDVARRYLGDALTQVHG